MNTLNPSIKHHLLIGIFMSFWVFIFTFYIKPFDTGIGYTDWKSLSIGLSTIVFICYAIVVILQKVVYNKFSKWNVTLEISVILLFHILNLVTAYIYYKSPILRGAYAFLDFSGLVLQWAIIFTPILILARIYVIRLIPAKPEKKAVLTIKGENKLDLLKIDQSDLVCITNAQNYVEIFFIQNGHLSSKLIRSSLRKMKEELTFLIQVHRSHLINPLHFRSWKNANTMTLTHIEVPVSKNFKKDKFPG